MGGATNDIDHIGLGLIAPEGVLSVTETTIDKLTTDQHNANAGTVRGRYLLDHSLRQYGAGRSILVDKEGRVIAGNKTLEAAADIGLEDVVIVQTDGTKLVAVQRTDLDLDNGDDKARLMAYADNRSSEVGLEWSAEAIQFDLEAGLDLSGMFQDVELTAIMDGVDFSLPDPQPQKEPELVADHFIEMYCSDHDLDELGETLREWGSRPSVTVNIS